MSDKLQFVVMVTKIDAAVPKLVSSGQRQTGVCRTYVGTLEISCARQQLPQHIRQNAAVLVVFDLDRRIDPQRYRHLLPFRRLPDESPASHPGVVVTPVLQAKDIECLACRQASAMPRLRLP